MDCGRRIQRGCVAAGTDRLSHTQFRVEDARQRNAAFTIGRPSVIPDVASGPSPNSLGLPRFFGVNLLRALPRRNIHFQQKLVSRFMSQSGRLSKVQSDRGRRASYLVDRCGESRLRVSPHRFFRARLVQAA